MAKSRWATKLAIVVVGIAVLVVLGITPTASGLSWSGKMALGIFLVSILFWVTEVMPLAISAWAMAGLVPLLGIMSATDTWTASINNAIIFYLCCFAFASFVGRSSIAVRLTGGILKWAGTNSSRVLLGFMVGTALISTLMDNLPLTAVMLPIAYGVLDANKTPTGGKSPFAKCIAIGIPWAAAIGGAMTPSGCIINVLAMTLIEQNFDVHISFVQWMAFGVPLAIITIPAGWLALVKIFKPEQLTQEAVDSGIQRANELSKMPRNETLGLAVMLITMVVWIASSWVPSIDITVVSLIALGFMFFPGINAISFDDFLEDSPWGMMLLMMAVNVLVAALMGTGATQWLVDTLMAPMVHWPLVVTLLLLSMLACILHNVIPAGPACAGLIAVPFATIVAAMGGSIAATCAMVGFWSAISLMLPLDGVPLLSYSSNRHYFSFGDMLKTGWVPSLVIVLITVFLTPATAMLMGLS